MYVETLLRMALSFAPDTLDALESRFIEFLDQTCRLRTLPLQDIDFSSKEAFCIFVNLYHLLLQHSLLLAVDGLPNMVRLEFAALAYYHIMFACSPIHKFSDLSKISSAVPVMRLEKTCFPWLNWSVV